MKKLRKNSRKRKKVKKEKSEKSEKGKEEMWKSDKIKEWTRDEVEKKRKKSEKKN